MINKLKKEAIYLGILLLLMAAMLKIIFLKESIIITTRTALSLFWLFILPGFAIMFYWHEKLEFIERLIIGTVLSMAVTGVIGYNLSVIGIHIKYHALLLPVAMIGAAALMALKKKDLQAS